MAAMYKTREEFPRVLTIVIEKSKMCLHSESNMRNNCNKTRKIHHNDGLPIQRISYSSCGVRGFPILDRDLSERLVHWRGFPILDQDLSEWLVHCRGFPILDQDLSEWLVHCRGFPILDQDLSEWLEHCRGFSILDQDLSEWLLHCSVKRYLILLITKYCILVYWFLEIRENTEL